MRIAIVAPSPRPFVFGGAERLWLDLCQALNTLTPHEVELIKLPSPEADFWSVVDAYARFFRYDGVQDFDAVVVTKYPAWMVPHPRKIVYLQHRLRGLYDTYPAARLGTALPPLPASLQAALSRPLDDSDAVEALFAALAEARAELGEDDVRFSLPGPLLRATVHALDGWALAPARVHRYAAISHTVRNRAGYFPDAATVWVAPHPSALQRSLLTGPTETPVAADAAPLRLIAVSRLDVAKRLDWVVEAVRRWERPVRLTLVGSGPEEGRLRTLAAGDDRITFAGRLSDADLARAYACAEVAVFCPYDEDMGLVALEAMAAGCPVLTCADSGGVTEFVSDGVTGWVTAPGVEGLLEGLERAWTERERLPEMGRNGRALAQKVDWPAVLQALGLACAGPAGTNPRRADADRLRVLVLAPFGLRPPRFGGAQRVHELYRALGRRADVSILCPGPRPHAWQAGPGCRVLERPLGPEFFEVARDWQQRLRLPAGDVALLTAPGPALAALRETAAALAKEADAVVLSHPWMLPACPREAGSALIYDAHNVESALKQAMWRAAGAAEVDIAAALKHVAAAEDGLVREAARVATVSLEDREVLAERCGLDPGDGRFVLVPNGVAWYPAAMLSAQRRLAARCALLGSDAPKAVALFVGSLHQPNEEALLALLPVVRKEPEILWLVAGSVCRSEAAHRLADAGWVRLLDTLDDAALLTWLEAVDFGINPMCSGGGTNLKVLQYAMAGVVVVSTPLGLRGYPNEPCWAAVCETAEFGAVMRALIGQPAAMTLLRERGRALALQYTWAHSAEWLWASMKTLHKRGVA